MNELEIGTKIEVVNSEHLYFLKRGEIISKVDSIYQVRLDGVERIVMLKEQDMIRVIR
ncbi:hypothetical protein [Brevibacillus sp. NRS-1366]|uniref:hypothetical protein n=1 Tax=Brevibacillus sp. NRS-1366 TaxID=3233899 RepID=UPI003D1C96F5